MAESNETRQNIDRAQQSAVSGTGDATVYITNYYYREERSLPSPETPDGESLTCPYRGLYHFRPEDKEFFFGREIFVTQLVEATRTRNFLPVLGASGSGKSSVVFAGLLPALQQQGNWQFTYFRPGSFKSGEDLFYGLAQALVPLYNTDLDNTDRLIQVRKLAGALREGNIFLSEVLAQIRQSHPGDRVLLIGDQFEELYTLCPEAETRHKFLDCLLEGFFDGTGEDRANAVRPYSDVVFILTMRADFLGNALSYRPFADRLTDDIKLGAMNGEELARVVTEPAKKLGVTFEDGLVNRILDDVESEPGNLPLLEFALTELWDKRRVNELTHKAYTDIGEVQGALARYADRCLFAEGERERVRHIFVQLVRPGQGAEDTRRLATKAELAEENWSLVKELADKRLVVTSRNAEGEETVEVVHEALIRSWGKLRGWMEEDRSFRVWQENLRVQLRQWQDVGRSDDILLRGVMLGQAEEWLEKRRNAIGGTEREFIEASIARREQEKQQQRRRQQRTIGTLAATSVVFLGLAGWAGVQWRQAEQAKRQAELNNSNVLTRSAEQLLDRGETLEAFLESLRAVTTRRSLGAEPTPRLASALHRTISQPMEINTLSGHQGWVNQVSWSPDGTTLASASDDGMVKLWNPQTGEALYTLSGHQQDVTHVSWSPDGETLASASQDGTVKLWNGQTGEKIYIFFIHQDRVVHTSWSPNGETLASASEDGTVRLWDTYTGELQRTLSRHQGWLVHTSWSPDGNTLASASWDPTVKLWNPQTGEELHTLSGHQDDVNHVSWSPDGTTLASASDDGTVKLWNPQTGEKIHTLSGHQDDVNHVSWSPDGTTLASASGDGTVKLWNFDLEELLAIGCRRIRYHRGISEEDRDLCEPFGN